MSIHIHDLLTGLQSEIDSLIYHENRQVAETLHTNVIAITQARLEEATEVLTCAFEHDPLIQYIFADTKPIPREHIRDIYRFTCQARLLLGEPLFGVLMDGHLVGVACISAPQEKTWTESMVRTFTTGMERFGVTAAERIRQYNVLQETHRLPQPHFTLIALGVHPQAQGKGYGAQLLRVLHKLSEADLNSTGVALDTENPVNVPLYEHFGYQLVSKARLGEVNLWYMFRPNLPEAK